MKKFILLIVALMVANVSFSQETAMVNSLSTGNHLSSDAKESLYVFDVIGEIPTAHVAFEESHFLGDAVSKKWNTFLYNYVHSYENSVGLSGSVTEISKPIVYHAVIKADNYVKKALKKKILSSVEAITLVSHMLDCANVICTESDTKNFEKELVKIDNGHDILVFFDKRVQLKKM